MSSWIKKYKDGLRRCVSPLFVSNFYNKRDIKGFIKKYEFGGKIIDFGCGNKPYQDLFSGVSDYTGIDFKKSFINSFGSPSKTPDYYFGEEYLRDFKVFFADESFDHAVSFQVLEHHCQPEVMISELFRIIKKGGYLLLSAPFLEGVHGEPNDYQRFTRFGIEERIKKYGDIIAIKEQGSILSIISMFINESLIRFTGISKFHYILGVIIFPPFLLFSYLAVLIDSSLKPKHFYLNYLVLARKR